MHTGGVKKWQYLAAAAAAKSCCTVMHCLPSLPPSLHVSTPCRMEWTSNVALGRKQSPTKQ